MTVRFRPWRCCGSPGQQVLGHFAPHADELLDHRLVGGDGYVHLREHHADLLSLAGWRKQ